MVIHLAQTAVAHDNGSFGELLVYQLTGFIIVILVLCSLWVAVSFLGYLFRVLDIKDPVEPSSKTTSDTGISISPPALHLTPEIMAAMGAALHTVIQGPFKIVSVEESKSDKS